MSLEWHRAIDKNTGRQYWWNIRTRETRWELSPQDLHDSLEKIEARREKAANVDNRIGLEHMLSTFGWSGARSVPEEMIVNSIKPYAKGHRFAETQALEAFFQACRGKLDEERADLERLANEAKKAVQEAEEKEKTTKMKIGEAEHRRLLDEFLAKQTSLQKDEDRDAQIATSKARALKRMREREKVDLIGHSNVRSRPKREVKSRLVEVNGYSVLKENQYTMAEGIKTYSGSGKSAMKEIRPPLAAYGFFARDEIKVVRQADPSLDFTSIQRVVAGKWKDMDEDAKAPYRKLAQDDRDRAIAERKARDEIGFAIQAESAGSATTTPPPMENSPLPRSLTETSNLSEGYFGSQESFMESQNESSFMEKSEMEEDEEDEEEEGEESGNRKKPKLDNSVGGQGEDESSDSEGEEGNGRGRATPQQQQQPRSIIGLKMPRPTMDELCDCALLAIGPRSGCSEEEIENWIFTSPLGIKLKERLKGPFEKKFFQKCLMKGTSKGRYNMVKPNEIKISVNRLTDITKLESSAKLKRMRRESKPSSVQKSTVLQLRTVHNDEIKKAVLEAAFFRWSYLVRKRVVLEPFISDSVKTKLDTFKTLLESNSLLEFADPNLDDDENAWLSAMEKARATLDMQPSYPVDASSILPQPPTIVNGEMRQYQRKGLAWLVRMFENGCNAVLADEMGLGKTLQTISFLAHLKDVMQVKGPYLVIVPLSVLTNWANEFRKWCPTMRVVKLHSSNREERDRRKKEVLNEFKDFDVVITTYEMIVSPNMKNVLTSKLWWRCVVIDEGHKIKNDETSLSQAVRSMNCQYRLLLTGTPLQNNLHELWAMLNFLDPIIFDSSEPFDTAFDLARDIVDREILSKAHYLLRPFCLRRTKIEVESKLPPKQEIVVNVPLSEMQAFWYKRLILNDVELLERVEESVEQGAVSSSSANAEAEAQENPVTGSSVNDWKRLQSLMMQLRKCCNHPYLFPGAEPDFDGTTNEELVQASGKLQTLDLLLKKLQEKGHRVVIFSQFTSMLDILSDFLSFRRYKFARLDGSTNRVQRAVDVLQYNQADSTHFAYLMSTRAGGLGINLATADTVILYDSDWNPQVDLQAMDRVHRIGQEKPVHVYRLVTKGTIEERIVQRAKKKLFLDTMVNRGSTAQGEALESLSKAEMLKMLKFGASAVFGGNGDETEKVELLKEEEIETMIDRSETALKARQQDNVEAPGDNALEFDEKTKPVSLRDLYGRDYAQEAQEALSRSPSVSPVPSTGSQQEESSEQSSTTTSKPKKSRSSSSSAKKSKVDNNGDTEAAVRDIANEWRSTKSGRVVKSRFTKVDGHNVLNANMYTLEEGEKSVFASELANRRRGPDAMTLEEINRSLGRGRQVAGRDYTNEQHCLACWDGGELLLCDQCPVSVHRECLHPDQAPPARKTAPTWRCPHHSCIQCERKSAAAGGLLFRCSECLHAYCEDHLPLDNYRLHEDGRCLRFEELNFRKPAQGYYILCSPNCQQFFADREKFGVEEAIQKAIERHKTSANGQS